jgi:transposase
MKVDRDRVIDGRDEETRVTSTLPEAPTRSPRRHWSSAQKAAIVAEGFAPGAKLTSIARRYRLHPSQLYQWRRELRSAVAAGAGGAPLAIVPLVPESSAATGAATIEIAIGGGALLRVRPGVDLALLSEIIGLLQAASS